MQKEEERIKRPSQEDIINAMKAQGLEASSGSYNPESGDVRYSYGRPAVPKPEDKIKQIQMAMAGITDPEAIGREVGIPEPRYQAPEPQAQVMTPEGLQGIVAKADAPFDVPNYYQEAMKNKFAPNTSQEQISSDVLGLPKPQAEVPNDLVSAIRELKATSNTPSELKEKLADLYTANIDNPEAVKMIKLYINAISATTPKRYESTTDIWGGETNSVRGE